MNRNKISIPILGLYLFLFIFGFGLNSDLKANQKTYKQTAHEGVLAPSFSLKKLGKKETVSLSEFRGKVVLVDFWASWCKPCKKSLKSFESFAKENKRVIILAISIDDQQKNAIKFWGGIKGPIPLFDQSKSVVKAYEILGMPSAFIINQKGVLVKRFDGYSSSTMDQIEKELMKWL